MQHKSLWERSNLGPLSLKNRTVRSATNEHLSTPTGDLTSGWLSAYEVLAKNEVGLIITGHFSVERTQRADIGQPVLDDATTDITFLQKAASVATDNDCRLVAQLNHSGIKGDVTANERPAMSPVDFTHAQLERLVQQFVTAAKICQSAGLDGVQIHTAHGYLLSNFLNPTENTRTDEYGGTLENRFRIVREILSEVRSACGHSFALLVKADANGCGDLKALLQLYEQCGVDGIEVSGIDFANHGGERMPFYLDLLMDAKEVIHTPLMLVGGMFSLEQVQRVLDAGIPYVSFSRALIHNPKLIADLKNGVRQESDCLACNQCYRIYRQRPVRCVTHDQPILELEVLFGAKE